MIYGYARVSTSDQKRDGTSLEAQEQILRENGATEVYKDAFSGKSMDRPKFDELMSIIGEGDTLIFYKFDRFARTTLGALQTIENLMDRKVKVKVLNPEMTFDNDNDNPFNKCMRTLLFAIAELERDMIVQRTQEGKAIARTRPGYREGRPKKYDDDKLDFALNLIKERNSYTKVTKMTGISKSTLIRYKKAKQN